MVADLGTLFISASSPNVDPAISFVTSINHLVLSYFSKSLKLSSSYFVKSICYRGLKTNYFLKNKLLTDSYFIIFKGYCRIMFEDYLISINFIVDSFSNYYFGEIY